jgi:hypothetical protein
MALAVLGTAAASYRAKRLDTRFLVISTMAVSELEIGPSILDHSYTVGYKGPLRNIHLPGFNTIYDKLFA